MSKRRPTRTSSPKGEAAAIKNPAVQAKRALAVADTLRAQLASIVESSDDAMLSITLNGDIVTWNSGAERMYGYKAAEMIGKPVKRIFPDSRRDEAEHLLQRIKRGQSIQQFDSQRKTKDGSLIGVSLTVSPIRDASGKIIGASSIARDITQQQELLARQREFVSITSHELRTPLTALTGYLSLAQAERTDRAKQNHFIDRAFQAAKRLTDLTEDLLQVARLEEDRVSFQLRPLMPSKLVKEIVEDLKPTIEAKRMDVHFSALTPRARIRADRGKLTQVVRNLLDNSIKYTKAEGRIDVTVKSNLRSVAVSIRDNGIGIDARNLQRIFDKFFREYHEESVAAGGTGLGLFITKELVERQGGTLTVTGRRNRGTTAIVRFPRYAPKKRKTRRAKA